VQSVRDWLLGETTQTWTVTSGTLDECCKMDV